MGAGKRNAPQEARQRPRILLLAMYQLDEGRSGPTLRIGQLREALARRVPLDLVSGTRLRRSGALLSYLLGARLRGLGGIYVESSTSIPGPADLLFLAVARSLRIPVVSYIRDAYQLFPEYYPLTSWHHRISRAAFLPVFRALARISSVVAFPSRGLARAVLGATDRAEAAALLPPGARLPDVTKVDPGARGILYVGSLAHSVNGGDLLVEAIRLARARVHDLELICVVPRGQEPLEAHEAGIEVVHASGPEIDRLLPRVLATITPRRKTPYNDLAVPIKVMEYLGYGRPLIVTDTVETAAIVRSANCGIVVPDTAQGLADGIVTVAKASATQLNRWGKAARAAAAANSWDVRAASILELLGVTA
jgi:glycosyltransferase involved in cell wall biosynthesis